MSAKDEINKLKKEIERHNFLYHSENNPEINVAAGKAREKITKTKIKYLKKVLNLSIF